LKDQQHTESTSHGEENMQNARCIQSWQDLRETIIYALFSAVGKKMFLY